MRQNWEGREKKIRWKSNETWTKLRQNWNETEKSETKLQWTPNKRRHWDKSKQTSCNLPLVAVHYFCLTEGFQKSPDYSAIYRSERHLTVFYFVQIVSSFGVLCLYNCSIWTWTSGSLLTKVNWRKTLIIYDAEVCLFGKKQQSTKCITYAFEDMLHALKINLMTS